MDDVERRKSGPDGLEAAVRKRQSVAYPLDWVTDRLGEVSSFFKKFEEVAETLGYVGPRILRERQRRMERRPRKEFVNIVIKAARLAILFRRSRGSEKPPLPTSSTSAGEEARENRG